MLFGTKWMAELVLACIGSCCWTPHALHPLMREQSAGVCLVHLCSRATVLVLVGHYSVALGGPQAKSLSW